MKPMRGGLKLPAHKAASTRDPILAGPRPRTLVLPLRQHAGEVAEPLVAPGEAVARYQPLARATGFVSAPVHAPASGTVIAIEPRPIPHASGLDAPCIVLETAAADVDWADAVPLDDWADAAPEVIRAKVHDAGIVGLGGGAFPAHVKLEPGAGTPIHTLVLNGAECEPYISCDDRLMRERADRVVLGARIMMRALQATRCVIAVEEDKPEALASIRDALATLPAEASAKAGAPTVSEMTVEVVPAVYPQGGERQLIETLTGRVVPRDGLPLDIGIVCHNVGTAAAVTDAVVDGVPLVRRVVTVTGAGVASPRNVDALLGTPIAALVEACGGYTGSPRRLLMGGPMMGIALPGDDVPVVKATNCIVAATAADVAHRPEARPCIRCGECADVCPAGLLPQQLFRFACADDLEQAESHALFACIECGCCDLVCPSHIRLVDHFRWAMGEIWARDEDRRKAELAKRRFDARTHRLEFERTEREARLKRNQDPAAIAATLERAGRVDDR